MSKYRLVTRGTTIPVPGGKTIDELFGNVNTGTDQFSLAHMVAPPDWSEPPQTPDFGELTLMIRGSLTVDIEGEAVDIRAGQALWVEPGATVHYRNTSNEECEYFALCLPAFTPERAHRHE